MDLAVAGIDPSLASLAYDHPPAAHWTFFEDDRLAQAVRSDTVNNASWELVAEQVGTGKTSGQCEARWRDLGFRDFEAEVRGGAEQDRAQEDLQVDDGPNFGHVTDEQARVLLMESLGYQDDIPVTPLPSTSHQPLPSLPSLPPLLAAASTASERLSIMHTTASPSYSLPSTLARNPDEEIEDASKKHWRPEEDKKLLALVGEHGPRNWGRLAKTLGTGRTGPSCCARWCRLAGDDGTKKRRMDKNADAKPKEPIPETHKSAYASIAKGKRQKWAKWSSEEDSQLASLVKQHGLLNWIFIASLMPSDPESGDQRSHDSCQARWNHYLCKREEYQDWIENVGAARGEVEGAVGVVGSKATKNEDADKARARAKANAASSRWMPSDDAHLISLLEDNPTQSWAWLGEQLEPKRSAGSCRARWAQQITKGEEEKKKIKARKDGSQNESAVAAAASLVASTQGQASSPLPSRNLPSVGSQDAIASPTPVAVAESSVVTEPSPDSEKEGGEPRHDTEGVEEPVEVLSEEEGTAGVRTRARRGAGKPSSAPAPKAIAKAKKVTRRAPLRWTETEEHRLGDLVAEHGTIENWGELAALLGTGRTGASVQARWWKIKEPEDVSGSPLPEAQQTQQSQGQYDPSLELSLLEAIASSVSVSAAPSPHSLLPTASNSTSAAASPLPDIHLPEDLALSLSASPFDPQSFFGAAGGEGGGEQTPEEAQRELQMLLEGLMGTMPAQEGDIQTSESVVDSEGEKEGGLPKRLSEEIPRPSPRMSKRTRRSSHRSFCLI